MSFFARVLAVWIFVPVFAAAFQETPATYTISGTVAEHDSNRPLNGVLVTIRPVATQNAPTFVITGEDGRFVFTKLVAGKYSLAAQRRGEPAQLYQQHGQFSTAIAVGPGLTSEGIIFPMKRFGRITGTVLDDQGDPAVHAYVMLLKQSISNGASRVIQSGGTTASVTGAFHFAHVEDGTYFLAITGRPWYAQSSLRVFNPPIGSAARMDAPDGFDVAYPVTYYGDTTDPGAAQPVALAEGGSVSLQVTLHAVPAVHVPISGIEPKPGLGIGVTVFADGPGGVRISTQTPMMAGPDGFELDGVAPGHYEVQLHQPSPGNFQRILTQSIDITAGSSINVQAAAETSVTGQILFESGTPGFTGISVAFLNGRPMINQAVHPDGSFSMPGPPIGRYEISLSNLRGYYVKSVAVKGNAISSGDTVEVKSGGPLQLSIVAAPVAISKLEGVAVKDDKPAAGAMVLLLPEDWSKKTAIRRDQSDSDGTFTLGDIPPGRYTLLAIDDGISLLYQDREAMKAYMAEGQVLTIPGDMTMPVTVNVVSRSSK